MSKFIQSQYNEKIVKQAEKNKAEIYEQYPIKYEKNSLNLRLAKKQLMLHGLI